MAVYYPVFLNISGKRCVVIGGGEVAERKVVRLLEAGARVKVITTQLSPRLKESQRQGEIEALARDFQPGDLEGAYLAIAATNDPEVNGRIVREAREKGILVNVVDRPEECDFIVPSVVRRGHLMLAISTGGRSPALARSIREELEARFGPEYASLLDVVSQVRQELTRRGLHPSPQAWQEHIDSQLVELVRQGKSDQAKERLRAALEAQA